MNIKSTFKALTFVIVGIVFLHFPQCKQSEGDKLSNDLKKFIADYETQMVSLNKNYNLAAYNASISGKKEDYQKATELKIAIGKVHSNIESFAALKELKKSEAKLTDSMLRRQLNILYLTFSANQVDEQKMTEIAKLEEEIEQKFSTYRPNINEKSVSDNEIEEVLRNSTDSKEVEKFWKASKEIGNEVLASLKKLVKLRNEVAKSCGYKNFYEMKLITSGQNPEDVSSIYEELDILTRGPYTALKSEIDEYLAKRFKIKKEELMPWHYQNRFFQEAPTVFNVNFDSYYKDKNPVDLAKTFFNGIGLNVEEIIKNSDLQEKEGKAQHPYSIDIDRGGDVRVVANVKPNEYWMNSILYELGFSVFLKNVNKELPFVLRTSTHFFINDAFATWCSRFSVNDEFLKTVVGVSNKETEKIRKESKMELRLSKFVFSRWTQVIYHFEKELYESPEQDLNKLWWTLVENYQLLKRPKDRNTPDWAAKAHIVSQPCVYHNYMLGELFASQLHYYIVNKVISSKDEKGIFNNPEVGKYFIEKVFKQGATMNLNELVKYSTGESLSADYFTTQFIKI